MGEVQDQPRQPGLRALRGSAGFYSHWDDHEFVNDFSPAENSFDNGVNVNGRTLYNRGAQAFRDYAPVRWTRRDGLYRTVRWGATSSCSSSTSARSAAPNADEGGVCNNPQTASPTSRRRRRRARATCSRSLTPSLAQPVSQACLDRDQQPGPDLPRQAPAGALPAAVEASDARFKVIMNEMPIQQYYVLPYDRWEGYEAERQRAAARAPGT